MFNKLTNSLTRRGFFASSSAAALSLGATTTARATSTSDSDAMTYEVVRTDDEWKAMLNDLEYLIMREGRTEKPKSSPLWDETRNGSYHCKGCDLCSYEARWKVVLDKGWVFFYHAQPDTVLMSIDGAVPEYGDMTSGQFSVTEVHCRRCASHLGHYVYIAGRMTHCINGASLVFKPLDA